MSASGAITIALCAAGGMFTTGLIFYGMRSIRHAKAANYLADHPAKSFFIGFLGFLIGPVIIGFISNMTNLIASYVFLAILVVLSLALTYFKLKPISKA